jgi:hypothetical protein
VGHSELKKETPRIQDGHGFLATGFQGAPLCDLSFSAVSTIKPGDQAELGTADYAFFTLHFSLGTVKNADLAWG